MNLDGWRFRAAAACLLAVMAFALVTSMLRETQTWDEGIHIVSGYSYWKTGDYRLNAEHPPLFKLLCALPLLALNPHLHTEHPAWKDGDQVSLGDQFLYNNTLDADTILRCGRSVTIAETLLLGVLIAWWTRRKFGSAAALTALFLFALDPNIIAHGRYVTNDLLITLAAFAAVAVWNEYLEHRRVAWLAAAAFAFAIALVSKFSGVFLIPVFALLWLVQAWKAREWRWKRALFELAAIAAVAASVIAVVYGPETARAFRSAPPLAQVADRSNPAGKFLWWATQDTNFPAHPYFTGLDRFAHNTGGHAQYLLGRHSEKGWWYYFPVAFAVKTPTAVLGLIAVSFLAAIVALFRRPLLKRVRGAPLAWYSLVIPPVLYFGIVMQSPKALGIRYLLPVYPFLFVLLAAVLFHNSFGRRARIAILAAASVVQIGEAAYIYPHYLAFFNTPSGGPAAGPRYLADSNIDWGQDVRKLRSYLQRIGWKEPVCTSYFGRAMFWYYGIPEREVPATWNAAGRAAVDCIAAVSVTQLLDVYTKPGTHAWLLERRPEARVGYSIYVYDLRKNRTPIDWGGRGR